MTFSFRLNAAPLAMAFLLALAACGTPRPSADPSPRYKIGKPYKVKGRWYYPREDPDYEAVGLASWYGRDFHGRPTANGETFDMRRLSAAHTTLPLPSLVEVKNLENGRKIVVRVNDRGPFARGRIIDLSRAAARRLGFERKGLARVRVRYVGRAPLAAKAPAEEQRFARAAPIAPEETAEANESDVGEQNDDVLTTATAPAPGPSPDADAIAVAETDVETNATAGPTLLPAADIAAPEVEDSGIIDVSKVPDSVIRTLYVIRVATLSRLDNIDALKAQLEPIGPLRLSRVEMDGEKVFYRVSMGPFASAETAADRLEAVRDAGYDDAVMITLTP